MAEDKTRKPEQLNEEQLQEEQLNEVSGGRNGTTVEQIMKVNKELKNPDFIRS